MEWQEIIEHPSLKDLPFKIETDEFGRVLMTPASGTHGMYQMRIGILFERFGKGQGATSECPIQTSKGVRVADVAWGSPVFFKKHGFNVLVFQESPEVVIEIKSPSNSIREMEEKRDLYFEAGAKEFWFCDERGDMHFFNPYGQLERSLLFPEFLDHIDLD